ncbi:MAG: PEGA domain-containing protein [Patescibacteria group bacterium]
MKVKLALLTVLLFLFILFIVVKFFILDTQNNFGQLKINSSPSTSVFIGSVLSGKTPFDKKLKTGTYDLKLIPGGEASSSATWQAKVNVYKNTLTYVNRELGASDVTSAGEIFSIIPMNKSHNKNMGEISVESEPIGAIVSLDNDEKEIAPLLLGDVPVGTHELTISLPGFFPRIQKINVDEGMRSVAFFKLAVDVDKKLTLEKTKKEASSSATIKPKADAPTVTIKQTPTGWLRVREEPSINSSESAKINPGDTFILLEEQLNWLKIEYEKGKSGWVSAEYAEKTE